MGKAGKERGQGKRKTGEGMGGEVSRGNRRKGEGKEGEEKKIKEINPWRNCQQTIKTS